MLDTIGILEYISAFLDINILLLLDIAIGVSYRFKKVIPAQQQYVTSPQQVGQQPVAYIPVYSNQVVPAVQQTENQQ